MPVLMGLVLLLAAVPARSEDQWTAPTPDELKMTSLSQVPGAPAVYLDYDQTNDEDIHQVTVYVRIKILTAAGLKYGDVALPYDKGDHYSIKKIEARTIHSDGTVIPFTGKPFDQQAIRAHSIRYNEKVFTMPDVTVGSILEYRYVLHYSQDSFIAPRWYAQQDLFVLREHFVFQPDRQPQLLMGGASARAFEWTSALPKGVNVQRVKGQWELTLQNVSPLADEVWMPPKENLESKVLFYYINPSESNTADGYWARTGKWYSAWVDFFADEDKLKNAALSIVSPGDSDAVKVARLYDAVMGITNTDLTREKTEKEAKAEHAVINTAADVWNAKEGNGNQIALLFIGLARAAGLKAYAMWVSDRSQKFFEKNYLSTDQLDDEIAIVVVDGKEEYFDPGVRFCQMGKLAWYDTASMGLRQGPSGAALASTPGADFRDAETGRRAQLQLDSAGNLTGTIRVTMSGAPALAWRQRALETDAAQVNKEFEDEIRKGLPRGVQVSVTGFEGLADWKPALVANLTVSGTLGTRAGKLLLLPASFFEASEKSQLLPETRQYAIYMDYGHAEEDDVSLALPPGMAVKGMPTDASFLLKDPGTPTQVAGEYQATYRPSASAIALKRILVVGLPLFPSSYYSQIRDFYGKLDVQDQEQVVLQSAQK